MKFFRQWSQRSQQNGVLGLKQAHCSSDRSSTGKRSCAPRDVTHGNADIDKGPPLWCSGRLPGALGSLNNHAALHEAVQARQVGAVEIILKAGASPSLRTCGDESAVDLAT